ncbi:MAG: hypothetical protein ABI835_02655 [Chloroflexota bacterium]
MPTLRPSPLLRVMVALSCLFALLIVVGRAFGSTQPPPPTLAHLHLTDCTLPCWLGITPGHTHFEEAVIRVTEANPGSTFTSGIGTGTISAFQMGAPYAQAGIYADLNGLVAQITLLTAQVEGITFGDVVSFLGTPACAVHYPASAVYLSDTAFAVLIGARSDQGWRTPLNHIEIRTLSANQQPCTELHN